MSPHPATADVLSSSSPVCRRLLVLVVAVALVCGGVSVIARPASAAAPARWSQNVRDTFHRVSVHGFGAAPRGGHYADLAVPARVAAGHGILGPLSPGQAATVLLPHARGADERLRATFVVPAAVRRGYGTFVSVVLRRQSDGAAYFARVRIGVRGILRVSLGKMAAHARFASLTGERAVRWTARPSTLITVEGQITGGARPTLAVRAWPAGRSAPAWQLTATDRAPGALSGSGSVGVYAYRAAGSSRAAVTLRAVQGWTRSVAGRTVTPAPSQNAGTASAPTASRIAATAGSAPLGQARYAVPAAAIYVARSGSDSTGTGASSAPYASLRRALSASSDGDTIVLRAGSYNENVFVAKSVTIEAYPGEVVWLDGSIPVTGWQRTSAGWTHRNWTYRFDHSASTESGSNAGGYLTATHPLAAYPDQVFMNAGPLTQVAGRPGAGQFSVDYAAQTITVGSDPTAADMRASNLSQALVVGAGHVTLRGFGVRNYATPLPAMGTVYLGGSTGHILVQNLIVQQNATQGISVYAPDVRIDHVTSTRNGMTGIHATRSNRLAVTNCDLSYNNAEHFNPSPAAGGIKVGRLSGVTISGNHVHDNFGVTGIWTDENVTNFTIANNVVDVAGAEYGILTELSDTGIVAGNVVSHAKYGYTAFDTGHVSVFNNTMAGNSVWDIGLSQDGRYLPGRSTAAVDPTRTCSWVVTGVTVANNDLSRSSADYQFYALDKETKRPADRMGITLAGNLFVDRDAASGSWPVGWGNGNIWSPTNYATVRAWEVAHRLPVSNSSITRGVTRAVSATRVLVPAPAPVAVAMGVAPGTRHLGAF